MMNHIHYTVLLTLIYKSCTSFLDFPSDNIRRLPALDIIGGYPSFFGAIYVYDGHINQDSNRIGPKSNRFLPLSTVLHFTVKNDPNCTIEQQAGDEENLLKAATMFEKKSIDGYVYGNKVRTNGQLSILRPDARGLCTHLYKQSLKYKVNYTTSCRWHFHSEKGCDVNDLIKFLSNQMNSTEICDQTGNQCVVPIFRNMVTISSDEKCDNYSVMSVCLATQQGSILGMLIEFLPSSNKCRENYCILTTKISFQEVSQRFLDKIKMSRYENSEGRFRCPSEVTCPAELFYFLNTCDHGEFSTQFFVVIPLLALFLLYVS
ncbi:unnamed protein product [Cercopithifilaria johnstoni]|uniref:Uncharacterized protein n=1 Tax=Cercopithifilaria johnstoni TaxID=2874296 RepID=A0A8J2LRN7_9BILA|nr:unnamed protein product [Cercopithifilaria johnstoni]